MGFGSTTRGKFDAEDPRPKIRAGRDELRDLGLVSGTNTRVYALFIDGGGCKHYTHNERSGRWYRNSDKSPSGKELLTGRYEAWLRGELK
jgi:hypothetical protein